VFSKLILLIDWHAVRVIRLICSGTIASMAWQDDNMMLGFLSALLLLQVITNSGCGAGGCSVPRGNIRNPQRDDFEFTEIKTKLISE
jgi:hypothetical protein